MTEAMTILGLIQALQLQYTHSCHQGQPLVLQSSVCPCIPPSLAVLTCFSPYPGQSWNVATETSSVQKASCCLHSFTRVQPPLCSAWCSGRGNPKGGSFSFLNAILKQGGCAVGESSSSTCSTFE